MAKHTSSKPVHTKGGLFNSQSGSSSSHHSSLSLLPASDTDSKVTSKNLLRESQVLRRESVMNLKNIFVRNKFDSTDKCSLISISECTQYSFLERGMSTGGISAFSKKISRKGNFMSKDLCEQTKSDPTLSINPVKKIVPACKISRSPSSRSNQKLISTKISKQLQNSNIVWELPSLDQAYQQAIKYSQLYASTLSADAIIRIDSSRKSNTVREKLTLFDSKIMKNHSEKRHKQLISNEKTELPASQSQHCRKSSKYVTKAEWTEKIFILVKSGYLLEYSASGRSDRLPEKVLQLGKDSVAFASDAIPGKHWVLQVSHSMSADGTPIVNSRSLISRLNFKNVDFRKIAKSLLLVFDSADHFESWIYVLRREIKALGGRLSDTASNRYYEEKPLPLPKQSCQKFLLQSTENNPPQSSPLLSPISSRDDCLIEDEKNVKSNQEAELRSLLRHHSVPTMRSSIGNYSITNSIFSHDDKLLESLGSSQHRSSYMSSSQRTMITSQSTSPSSSPVLCACNEINLQGQTNYRRLSRSSDIVLGDSKDPITPGEKFPELISDFYLSPNINTSRNQSHSKPDLAIRSFSLGKSLSDTLHIPTLNSYNDKKSNSTFSTSELKQPLPLEEKIQMDSCISLNDEKALNSSVNKDKIKISDVPMIKLRETGKFELDLSSIGIDNVVETIPLSYSANLLQQNFRPLKIEFNEKEKHQLNIDAQRRPIESNIIVSDLNIISVKKPLGVHPPKDNFTTVLDYDHENDDFMTMKRSRKVSNLLMTGNSTMRRISPSSNSISIYPHHIADQLVTPLNSNTRVNINHHTTENHFSDQLRQDSPNQSISPEHRRSLPSLVNGPPPLPPPLPPPRYALPPLPCPNNTKKSRELSTGKKSCRTVSDSYL